MTPETACDNRGPATLEEIILRQKNKVRDLRRGVHDLEPRARELEHELTECIEKIVQDHQKENEEFLSTFKERTTLLLQEEGTLRENLVRYWTETGKKTFDSHLKVRVMTDLRYGLDQATKWAKANAPFLLVLDKKAFEKLALVNDAIDFVERIDRPIAAIAKDLEDDGADND